MAKELILVNDGKLCFGDYSLAEKSKLDGFSFGGNLYKVKTYKDLTKLERDGMFVYESEPGSDVSAFEQKKDGISFEVAGEQDAMITVGLKEDTNYEVFENGNSVGTMKTNLGGKLSLSVSLSPETKTKIEIKEA
ncbi:MAG: endosialidase [Lachnospiraceae bacterium]|nr:endosialidase [Lachnospiraceae bacterium]MCR5268981.1 endosialidase [Lachnospiraceae bacterium]